MKNKTIIPQLLAAFVCTGLLYNADLGLNALLVALPVLALLAWSRHLPLVPALLFVLAGLSVAISASLLSLVLYYLFFFMLVSHAQSSMAWPVALVNGVGRVLKGGWQSFEQEKVNFIPGFSLSKSLLLSLPPLGITLVFYALYANANPAFASTITLAHLELPNPSWFLMFSGLLYASFALAYALPTGSLAGWESRQQDVLLRRRRKNCVNPFWLKYEYKTALIALFLLNTLLLLFHGIDLASFIQGEQPVGGVAYREWVHQGVGTLIVSIVIAVALLMYVFRGNLNFFRQNQQLKVLAKAWIIQNALLALSAAIKNWGYVASYGLTYKRIGVWVYLLLVLVGLISTWIKINQKQTLWWMVKENFRMALLVLLFISLFPWARIIASHHLHIAKIPDMRYVLQLPAHISDQLLPYQSRLSPEQQYQWRNGQEALLESVKNENWKSWTLLNHYAAQNLETAQ